MIFFIQGKSKYIARYPVMLSGIEAGVSKTASNVNLLRFLEYEPIFVFVAFGARVRVC